MTKAEAVELLNQVTVRVAKAQIDGPLDQARSVIAGVDFTLRALVEILEESVSRSEGIASTEGEVLRSTSVANSETAETIKDFSYGQASGGTSEPGLPGPDLEPGYDGLAPGGGGASTERRLSDSWVPESSQGVQGIDV